MEELEGWSGCGYTCRALSHLHAAVVQPVNKRAISHAVLPRASVQAFDPRRSHVPLLQLAADVRVLKRLLDALDRD